MLRLEVDHIGANGDGVATLDEQTYYIPYTAPGDTVLADPIGAKSSGIDAILSEIVTPSPQRTQPRCRHFGTCGGCSLQHIDDQHLAIWKQNRIRNSLEKVGISDVDIKPTQTSVLASRRRVEFVAAKRKKGVMIGYHLKRSSQIFDLGECSVLAPELINLIKPLRMMLPFVMARKSEVRLTLTSTTNGVDLLISGNIVFDLAARELLANFGQEYNLCRISYYDEKEKALDVVAAIKSPEIRVQQSNVIIPPGAFLQATEESQETLISLILENLPSDLKVLDLFSGCGSFSLPVAHIAKSVHAFEGNEQLIDALKKAANKEMLPLTAQNRDLFRDPLAISELNKFDAIIIDPPRAGAKAQMTDIANCTVETILHISCNPSSFARDTRTLVDGGYSLETITPVDQFLWSSHVEIFSVLKKTKH